MSILQTETEVQLTQSESCCLFCEVCHNFGSPIGIPHDCITMNGVSTPLFHRFADLLLAKVVQDPFPKTWFMTFIDVLRPRTISSNFSEPNVFHGSFDFGPSSLFFSIRYSSLADQVDVLSARSVLFLGSIDGDVFEMPRIVYDRKWNALPGDERPILSPQSFSKKTKGPFYKTIKPKNNTKIEKSKNIDSDSVIVPLLIHSTPVPASRLFHRVGNSVDISAKASIEKVKVRQSKRNNARDLKRAFETADLRSQAGLFSTSVGLDPAVQQLLDGLSVSMSNMTDSFKNLSGVEESVGKMTEAFSSISGGVTLKHSVDPNFAHVPLVIGVAAVAYMAISTRDKKWIAAFLALSATYVGISAYVYKTDIQACIAKITDRINSPVDSQACADSITDIVGLLVGYLSFATAVQAPTRSKKLMAIVSGFGSFDKTKGGIMSAINFITNLFQRVFNWFRVDVLGLEAVNLTITTLPELQNWSDDVMKVANRAHSGSLDINSENSIYLHKLQMEGAALLTRKLTDPCEANQVKACVGVYMQVLRDLLRPFVGVNMTSMGPRIEPICVLLMGRPGVGKSTATWPLIKQILLNVNDDETKRKILEDYRRFIYSRSPEHVYWDGYNGQEVVILDDFGQTIDAPGSPDNEYMGFIRAANAMPFVLHMAELAQKGVTTFTARFIIATTNLTSFHPQSINDVEAIMRRFDFIIQVCPKKEFSLNPDSPAFERRLDKSLLSSAFDDDAYEFHQRIMKMDAAGELMMGSVRIYGWKGLADAITDKYKAQAARSTEYLRYVDSIGRDSLPEVLAEPKFADGVFVSQSSPTISLDKGVFLSDDISLLTLDEIIDREAEVRDPFAEFFLKLKSTSKLSILDAQMKMRGITDSCREVAQKMFSLNAKACNEALDSTKEVWEKFVSAILPRIGKFKSYFSEERMRTLRGERVNLKHWCADRLAYWAAKIYKFKWMDHWKTWLGAMVAATGLMVTLWKKDALAQKASDVLEVVEEKYAKLCKAVFEKIHGKNPHIIPWEELMRGGMRSIRLEKYMDGERLHNGIDATAAEYLMVELGTSLMTLEPEKAQILHDKVARVIQSYDFEEYFALWAEQMTENKVIDWVKFGSCDHGPKMKMYDWILKNYDRISPANLRAAEHFIQFESESGVPKKKKDSVKLSSARPHAYSQGAACPNEVAMVERVIEKNMYLLMAENETRERPMGYVTFVSGNVAIMPHHFVSTVLALWETQEFDKFTLQSRYRQKNVEIPISVFKGLRKQIDVFRTNDICLVEFPGFQEHARIVSYFISKTQVNYKKDFYCRIAKPTKLGIQSKLLSATRGTAMVRDLDVGSIRDGLTYIGLTQYGDCGSIITNLDKSNGPGKLMGIHVAGDEVGGLGISSIVFKEDLEEALKSYSPMPPHDDVLLEKQCMQMPFPGDFIPYLQLEKAVSQPIKTKHVPSVFYGKLGPVLTAPAMLRATWVDGVKIDPFHVTLPRYGPSRVMEPMFNYEVARDFYFRLIMKNGNINRDCDPRVFTFEEACEGICGDSDVKSVPRGTSAGYPYVMDPMPGFKGKQAYFGRGEKFDFTTPMALRLREEVDHIISEAKQGRRCFHVFVDTLKDETRKKARAESGDTRIISAAPLALTIAMRMYFLEFFTFLAKRNVRVGVGYGVNPYSGTWDILARELKAAGDHTITGDAKGFDMSQSARVIEASMELTNMYYNDGEVNKLVRRVLTKELSNSIHLYKDIIYQWFGSLPSGAGPTISENSFTNGTLIIETWVDNHPLGIKGLEEFEDNVKFCVCGDDSVVSTNDAGVKIMNYQTIQKTMAKHGIVYTDEDKSEIMPLSKKLSDVNFLKRKFRFEPLVGGYVAPLVLDSILDSLAWTQEGDKGLQITREKIETNLMELSLHSEEDFQKWAPLVVEVAREQINYYPRTINRTALVLESRKMEYEY